MKTTLGELKTLIRESLKNIAGSHPDEAYSHELMDDPALAKHSVLVPDDIKKKIRKWSRAMGLSHGKRKKRAS